MAEAMADSIEEDVDDRRGVESEHLAEQQAPTMAMPNGRRSSEPIP